MVVLKTIILVIVTSIVVTMGFIHSGIYPIGADKQHSPFVFWALDTLRKNSIARSAKNIDVPALNNPELLLSGGADYNEMCVACHLKPGQKDSDMSIGLYPSPPNLSLAAKEHDHDHGKGGHDDANVIAQQQFWVIKHGVMASGMAAFGPTHNDERIWAIVAFLQKLPELSPEQYQVITARH